MKFFALALLAFFSCKASQQTKSVTEDSLLNLIKKELGDKSTISKNSSATFTLAYITQDGSVQYIIIRMADQKVVKKESLRGTVNWTGEMQITETRTPGIVKKYSKADDNKLIIDLNQYVILNK